MSPNERIVILGGPRVGKSTLAREIAVRHEGENGWHMLPRYCGDPRSKVKEPLIGVTYLPEGIPLAAERGASGVAPDWIAENWFTLAGPWVMEGQVMARALRRYMENTEGSMHGGQAMLPCDRIIVLMEPKVEQSKGQAAMHAGVMAVWIQIEPYYRSIAEYR